ncbi:hypothetical protein C8035_v012130 [Colletotrichum spinosum]|uniref:Uncharacterized protein n=1 Tax=Colletotrichum spinosum TaxID=1347390 RepID=A0A4R8Q501_9PEZI|nr:hypothetical protein C8035_v012130 [Colletotrichum spinosum]
MLLIDVVLQVHHTLQRRRIWILADEHQVVYMVWPLVVFACCIDPRGVCHTLTDALHACKNTTNETGGREQHLSSAKQADRHDIAVVSCRISFFLLFLLAAQPSSATAAASPVAGCLGQRPDKRISPLPNRQVALAEKPRQRTRLVL